MHHKESAIIMLNIKTVKNSLSTEPEKNGYCFRSSCSQTLKLNKLPKEMAAYNSTFTEADFAGMLNVFFTIVIKHLAEGKNVEFPIGTLRPTATGTCSNIQDGFEPGTGNNRLNIAFAANEDAMIYLRQNLKYKRIPPDSTGEVHIYRVTSLKDDASESSRLELSAGKVFRLHGRNLSFNLEDEQQGVFLENETSQLRVTSYIRRGTNIIDIAVPSELAAGKYSISVVTKPGTIYFTGTTESMLTVS